MNIVVMCDIPERATRPLAVRRRSAWEENKKPLDWFEELVYGSLLAGLYALPHVKEIVRRRQLSMVIACRQRGIPWDYAGQLMKVSPQAVHQMWKRYADERNRAADLDESDAEA